MLIARLNATKSVAIQSSWQLNMAKVQAKSILNKSIAGSSKATTPKHQLNKELWKIRLFAQATSTQLILAIPRFKEG
ncbi:hypothetical protein Y032_0041g356 [Ancylostoma ceylanicum]|uniref:Uncharacterized protein n=1 Tax=Ancylostoma ceylanicum TaxID=53326 RepID=A0A016UFN8_9BILA|nr:hypothetical protein Y032_0041g356 [Ancylostoma ceylanicum]